MPDVAELARAHFDTLWAQASDSWPQQITPAVIENGVKLPLEYCVATVARLTHQNVDEIEAILRIREQLGQVAPSQFLYPVTSLHFTLLGCTQRFQFRTAFIPDRVQRIRDVCESVLAARPAMRFALNGIGIAGNQIFVQVIPESSVWAGLRSEMEASLLPLGEFPITYPNKIPIHMNLMMISDTDQQELNTILKIVQQFHTTALTQVEVQAIDLVLTDFVLSADNTTLIERFGLGSYKDVAL